MPYHDNGYILNTKSWNAIQNFYLQHTNAGLPFKPVLALVQAIATSPYASLIHGHTSHTDLLIFPYTPSEMYRDMLTITYFYQSNQFRLTYQEQPSNPTPVWQKFCSPDECQPIIEHLITHTLKWIPPNLQDSTA